MESGRIFHVNLNSFAHLTMTPENNSGPLFFTSEKTDRKTVPSNECGVCLESASHHKVVLVLPFKMFSFLKGFKVQNETCQHCCGMQACICCDFQLSFQKKKPRDSLFLNCYCLLADFCLQ